MKLEKISIKNFRNISEVSYDLAKINVFTGPNKKGKTNTIEAVYWALADYLMDGSSDYPSIKPHHNTQELVSVELLFEGFSFRKTYCEKWTKTRGSSEVTMTGHDTEYFIDDVKYSVSDGKKILLEKLGLSDVKTNSKIDIVRSILDPYYLAQTLTWKDLRAFIIDLVGDVDDLSVLNSSSKYSIIKDDLIKYRFELPTITKFYKQVIKTSAEEVEKSQNIITGYKAITDVDPTELSKAKKAIEDIENEIASLRVQSSSAVNPNVAKLEKAYVETQQEYMNSDNEDRKELQRLNAGINSSIREKESELEKLRKEYSALIEANHVAKKSAQEIELKKSNLEAQIKSKSDRKEALRKKWLDINNSEYQPSLISKVCKHCGGVLNDDEIEAHLSEWESNKTIQLEEISSTGILLKLELENLNLELKELESRVDSDVHSLEEKEQSLYQSIKVLSDEIESLRKLVTLEYSSSRTEELIAQGKEIKARLDAERLVPVENITDNLIAQKQAEKAEYREIIAKHDAYLAIQEKIVEVENQIAALQENQISTESKLMMLEEFIKTKLSLLKNNVASIFGDLEFVLVETNIKEGSYNEVCYPLILGKKTPFERGSGSERIITGTHIIECVKKAKKLDDIPIIFDEIDKLDTNTIATELRTNSQIISTKVDDINYKKVTLVIK